MASLELFYGNLQGHNERYDFVKTPWNTILALMEQQYVVYYRVSTKRQGDSGLGLESQRAYVNHFYQGKHIIAEFTDVRSGKTIHKRPQLQQALALCRQEYATLVVAKIDRLSRDTEQALWIYRQLDGRLESCDIPHLDKFSLTLFMAIADRERELISIRTRQALEQKVKQVGEWRMKGKNEKKTAAAAVGAQLSRELANENENNRRAAVVIRNSREIGKSWSTIAAELNAHGFRTAKGANFQAVQVQRIYRRYEVQEDNLIVK
ncbi:recombinase family protein [Nibrella saemangeumensis]|uniref:Recombinase family protein n=1 Tax=Nibrella saemangeumensis TaxID=1084526 RepID=A0ABP8N947_9BACT